MAAGDASNAIDLVCQYVGRVPASLVYAAFECLVVLHLFLDAFISFVAGELARRFGINLLAISETTSTEPLVSSLANRHLHHRLAHVNSMCNGCLISFDVGIENAPNVDNEKLHQPPEDGGGCSCCGEGMLAKLTYLPKLFKMISNAGEVNDEEMPKSALVFDGEEPEKLTSETESEGDDGWSSTMGTLEDDEGLRR